MKNNCFRYLLMVAVLVIETGCTNLFFQPLKPHLTSPEKFNIQYENVYIEVDDNVELHGWWFPAAEKPSATVLFLHGNGENISTHAAGVYWLTKHAYDVFIFDYRGYGKSQGVPRMDVTLEDIKKVLDYTLQRNKGEQKLIVMGHSLGASLGIAAVSEYEKNIDGVIFVSPFSEYRQVVRDMLSKSWLTWAFQWPLSLTISNEYSPIDYVADLPRVPTLFLYSNEDYVISADHVKRLFAKANEPKYIEQISGGHSGLFGKQQSRDVILKYINLWTEN
jgi:uncharacterized protein